MSGSAVVAGGIVFALLAAAAQTASFFCTRIFVTRMHSGPLKLMVLGHVIMGVMSVAALAILLPGRGIPPVWDCMGPLFTASLCYMLGQLSMFVALRYTEASRTAPLLGLKIVMLAFITTVFMDQHLGLAQWSAVGLAVLAAFAINFTGGPMPWQGVLGAVGACLPYSLSDLNVSTLVHLLDGGYGWHAPLVAVSLSYALCGLVSLLLLPWTGIGTRQDYRYAARGQVLLDLADLQGAEVEYGGREQRGHAGLLYGLEEVLECTRSARGDHGKRDGRGDGFGKGDVVAGERTVAIHARRQDLTRADLFAALGPCDAVETGAALAAADHHFEARGHSLIATAVDGDHHAV